MNTSILSNYAPIPTADPSPQAMSPRSANSADDVGGSDDVSNDKPDDVADESDKVDAFSTMLAALMGVSTNTPVVQTPAAAATTSAVESVTGSATDVPRDGAGAPLFASTFLSPSGVTSGSTTALTGTAKDSTIAPAAAASGSKSAPATVVGQAALSELAKLGSAADEGSTTAGSAPGAAAASDADGSDAGDAVSTTAASDEAGLNVLQMKAEGATAANVGKQTTTADVKAVIAGASPQAAKGVDAEAAAGSDSKLAAAQGDQQVRPTDPADEASAVSKQDHVTAGAKVLKQQDDQTLKNGSVEADAQAVKEQPAEETVEPAVAQSTSAEVKVAHSGGVSAAASNRSAGTDGATLSAEPAVAQPEMVVMPVEAAVQTTIDRDVSASRTTTKVDVEPAKQKMKEDVIQADASLVTTTNASQTGATSSATTLTHDSATVSTPVHVSQQVMQALAAYEADVPAGGSRSFQMLLDPPELGRLVVQMSRTSKGVDVRIAAENDSVRSILESSGQELQQGLQLSGFDLGQFNGSSSGGTFANGDEIVFAPSLQSFGASTGTATTSRTVTSVHASGAVNVVV